MTLVATITYRGTSIQLPVLKGNANSLAVLVNHPELGETWAAMDTLDQRAFVASDLLLSGRYADDTVWATDVGISLIKVSSAKAATPDTCKACGTEFPHGGLMTAYVNGRESGVICAYRLGCTPNVPRPTNG